MCATIQLQVPLACAIGKDCFVQQYFDHDATAGARDYEGGGRVYDGHDGTDFRVATLARARRGVNVVAAAAGVVRATRDRVADGQLSGPDKSAIAGRECGNGVLLLHPDGWETQYCHLEAGSLRVRAGESVAAGQPLGQVGLSGDTAFPHVHLSVRQAGRKIDPFAPEGDCIPPRNTMWTPAAAVALAYRRSEVLNAGFAAGPVDRAMIENEAIPAPRSTSPALVAWVRAIGLRDGDLLALTLFGADGRVAARSTTTLDHDKAEWIMFTGLKLHAPAWPHGRYMALFLVATAGRPVIERRFAIDL